MSSSTFSAVPDPLHSAGCHSDHTANTSCCPSLPAMGVRKEGQVNKDQRERGCSCCSRDEGYGRGRAKLGKQRVHMDCERIQTGSFKLLKVFSVPLSKRSHTPPEHHSRGLSRDLQLCPEQPRHIPRLCTALRPWNHGSKSSCGTGKAHSPQVSQGKSSSG